MRKPGRLGLLVTTAMTVALSVTVPAAAVPPDSPRPAAPAAEPVPEVMTKPVAPRYSRHSGRVSASRPSATAECVATSAIRSVCLKPAGARTITSSRTALGALTPVDFPDWCADSNGRPVAAVRTAACRVRNLILTTQKTVNNVTTVTGELNINVFDYTYGSVNDLHWGHQVGVAPNTGWGDAVNSTVAGSFSVDGDCVRNGTASFPTKALTPVNAVLRVGEAFATTTATAFGDVGSCGTTWTLVFTATGYPPASTTSMMEEISCDNAAGANGSRPARIGCVVPWFPATVYYSQSLYKDLASHVARAQASGLPGGSYANPLNRNTTGTVNTNRNLACGDAPSLTGRSCDEYPLASTYQGLAYGGSRRTFAQCDINAPVNVTGPTGASACMIDERQNSAQGGIMAAFNYDNRVLNGDPFLVRISS